MELLKSFFILMLIALYAYAKENIENIVPCTISEYVSIKLDTVESESSLKVDPLMYLGPLAIDIDDSGDIYILNADNNSIDKFDKKAKRCWSIGLSEQIMDIHVWGNDFFAFNGRSIFIYSTMEGKLIDSINIGLKKEDITPVGNVSKFYNGYLLINKESIGKTDQLCIFDLVHRKVSPKVPDGIAIYPIFNCPACSLTFVKSLFMNQGFIFLDQSDKFIAFIRTSRKIGTNQKTGIYPKIYLFNKSNGVRQVIAKIPFFGSLSFMSIRFCKFITSNEIVCCTIEQKNYDPKRLIFFKISINADRSVK